MEPIRVFCSYRTVDQSRVLAIAARLRGEQGIDAWVDAWEILGGDSITGQIDAGIAKSDVALIFLSASTLDSDWVRTEMGALLHRWVQEKKRLIPIFLDGAVPLPPLLSSLKAIPAENFDGLVRAIRGESGRPPLGPPPAAERAFRISLASQGERQLTVSATLDGREVAGPLMTPRGGFRLESRRPEVAAGLDAATLLARLGEAVGAAVFPGAVGAALETALGDAKTAGAPLALEFATAEPELLSIPFEAARLPGGVVPVLLPWVRVWRRDLRPRSTVPRAPGPGPLSILVAVGAPDEGKTQGAVLDLEAELQAILDAVEAARRQGNAFVRILEVGHPDEIEKALAERAYHVLHLSGHGGQGSIELETEDGEPFSTSAERLATALQRSGRRVPLVFLASCHGGVADAETASLAQGLLENGVPQVLAMQARVTDGYSTALAARFYERLAEMGVPLASRALAAARQGAEAERQKAAAGGTNEPPPEYATPALFLSGSEEPLFDRGLPPVAEASRALASVGGSVPRLKMGELIGRRQELRQVLRVLRDDERPIALYGRRAGVALLGIGGVGKSTLAGRTLERLAESGWRVVEVGGRFSLGDLAGRAAAELAHDPDAAIAGIAAELAKPGQPETERLTFLGRLVATHPVLLVLDNFESQLSPDGQSFLDPFLGQILTQLYGVARTGKLLITCRYPVPGAEAHLVPFHLGPLSTAESRKLLYRLPRLASQAPEAVSRVLRQIGGHPRVLEYLDALMNQGDGRLAAVNQKLRECAARAGVDVEDLGGSVDEALRDAFWMGAQDIFLDELLAIVATQPGDREILDQVAVFPGPVRRREVAYALAGGQEPDEADDRKLRATLRRLSRLSLVTPIEDDFVWTHRWTAEALSLRPEVQILQEACRRAGEALDWRLRTVSHQLEDAKEAARLFLLAEAWDRAAEESWEILRFLEKHGQAIDIVTFGEEIVERLPEEHDEYPGLLSTSIQALKALGATEAAISRMLKVSQLIERKIETNPDSFSLLRNLSASYNQLGDLLWGLGKGAEAKSLYENDLEIARRLAAAEPQRADYQRDLSVSFERMGDLLVALGEGEEARRFYQDALDLRRRLAAAEPQRADYQRDLSISYNKMGDLLVALGEGEEARRFYQDALDLRRRLAAAEPQRADYQRDLSVSFERMGDLLVDLGEGEEARRFYQDALELRRRLAAAEPQRADYQRDLSVSYNKMGDLLRALGEGEEARRFYQDALDLIQRLAAAEPQRADYQRDVAVSFSKMMSVEPENAIEHARNAAAILRSLKERGALLPPDEPHLRSLEASLAAAEAPGSAAEPE